MKVPQNIPMTGRVTSTPSHQVPLAFGIKARFLSCQTDQASVMDFSVNTANTFEIRGQTAVLRGQPLQDDMGLVKAATIPVDPTSGL
jgi:hypothetical protein